MIQIHIAKVVLALIGGQTDTVVSGTVPKLSVDRYIAAGAVHVLDAVFVIQLNMFAGSRQLICTVGGIAQLPPSVMLIPIPVVWIPVAVSDSCHTDRKR